MMFFLQRNFQSVIFACLFAAAFCLFSTKARAQEPDETYTNSAYLPELPAAPEFNAQILNCFAKEGYYIRIKEFTCPIGKGVFLVPELGMQITYGRNLDWEPAAYIGFPPPMPVCPSNGAVVTKSNYTEDETELLEMAVKNEEYKALYAEKHASYFLRAELNRILELDAENRWWYLLHATWEAAHCGAEDKYKLYALKTVDAARERLKKLSDDNSEYWVLNLIIPNLYRRTGDFSAAQKWLDKLGGKLPKDEKAKESFGAAFQLLQKAVTEKNTAQVPLQPEGGK